MALPDRAWRSPVHFLKSTIESLQRFLGVLIGVGVVLSIEALFEDGKVPESEPIFGTTGKMPDLLNLGSLSGPVSNALLLFVFGAFISVAYRYYHVNHQELQVMADAYDRAGVEPSVPDRRFVGLYAAYTAEGISLIMAGLVLRHVGWFFLCVALLFAIDCVWTRGTRQFLVNNTEKSLLPHNTWAGVASLIAGLLVTIRPDWPAWIAWDAVVVAYVCLLGNSYQSVFGFNDFLTVGPAATHSAPQPANGREVVVAGDTLRVWKTVVTTTRSDEVITSSDPI